VRLVGFGELPQPVPDRVVAGLREQVARINASGGLLDHSYHPGDPVKVKDGPFGGLDAIFQGPTRPSERVRILLEFLGAPREFEVSIDTLEPARGASVFDRQRRTRGGGRAIKPWPPAVSTPTLEQEV